MEDAGLLDCEPSEDDSGRKETRKQARDSRIFLVNNALDNGTPAGANERAKRHLPPPDPLHPHVCISLEGPKAREVSTEYLQTNNSSCVLFGTSFVFEFRVFL